MASPRSPVETLTGIRCFSDRRFEGEGRNQPGEESGVGLHATCGNLTEPVRRVIESTRNSHRPGDRSPRRLMLVPWPQAG
jgi:hypothetical protein